MSDTAVVYAADMLEHHPTGYDPEHPEWTQIVKNILGDEDEGGMRYTHPERPQRLIRILEALAMRPVLGLDWLDPQPADEQDLLLVHRPEHVELVESYRGRSGWLDVDTTAVSEMSVHAAEVAVGAAMRAVDTVLSGAHRRAMALTRPPGHHAYAARACGFCFYNNVAVAAAHARQRHGVDRVLILDCDVHHGNGTESIFYEDPGVMFVDMHVAAPFYPGTGALEDTGRGEGVGTTRNVPLPAGSGDGAMLEAIDAIVRPVAERFRPGLILVSSGFDGHVNDLIMTQTAEGYGAMTASLCELADSLTEGRIAFVLEGGYREALGASVRETLAVLAGNPPPPVERADDDPGLEAVREAARFHATVRT